LPANADQRVDSHWDSGPFARTCETPEMVYDCDVIVVGSGAGGATLAYACARAGKSVLLLERGPKYLLEQPAHDETAMLIDKKPYDDREVCVNGVPRRLYMGGVLGGGTALFGAALLRPSPDDFHPGRHYGGRIPRAIWDWPISYQELEPHYDEAEQLYGVAGSADQDLGPLPAPTRGLVNDPLPLHPMNEKLVTANRARGLRPFRLPLAIDPARCLRCAACAGYVCPTGARGSAAQLVERGVAAGLPLQVETNVEVERMLLNGSGNAGGVSIVDRVTGRRTVRRARRYVLAAGAMSSPALLLRSGAQGAHIGRHYMSHLSPIVVGVFPRRTHAEETFVKQLGFADYYFGTKEYPQKMGLVQSLPVPGPLMAAKHAPRLLPRTIVSFLRRRMLPLAGIVEDLPDPDNRVVCEGDGRVGLRHRYSDYDIERGRRLSGLMSAILKRAGAVLCLRKRLALDEHVAHQCGTLRFGTDSAQAVLGPDCRMFRYPNVFAADGSFFPTSLGVGPALTITANALRVAAIVTREL
jgi:choline dehydrogenase-like flavoprotein